MENFVESILSMGIQTQLISYLLLNIYLIVVVMIIVILRIILYFGII